VLEDAITQGALTTGREFEVIATSGGAEELFLESKGAVWQMISSLQHL